ncbi:hypothetical protein C6W89_01760 [Halomonas sp. SYSU XM8]|nr:hypothetical protein C6W89_01760 [Halomonas sp. SYSU XM8]
MMMISERTKNNSTIIAIYILVSLILSGCDNGRDHLPNGLNPTAIATMENTPYFISNAPSRYALSERLENIDMTQLAEDSKKNDGEAKLILGLIYLDMVTGIEEPVDKAYGLTLLQEAWQLGVVDAGHILFKVYFYGHGVRVNHPLALAYLEASAEKGYIRSQKNLAYAYRGNSQGPQPRGIVELDIEKARYWFTKAAEQGDAESATQLAQIYYKGLGVPKDDKVAFEWLKRAENMPFEGRMSHSGLAMCYEQGIGTEVDLVQAYKYYDLEDPAGAPDKRRLEAMMTPEQVQDAIRLSREWQEEHGVFVPSYYGLEYQPDGSFK